MTTIPTTAPPRSTVELRRLGSRALVAAGSAWAAYLALRPYGDETTLEGVEGIASPAWVASHLLGAAAFVLLALALVIRAVTRPGPDGWTARRAAAAMVVGAVFVLPYYGAETFGLHAIAAEAVDRGDATLLDVVDDVRYGTAAVVTFAIGLAATIASGVLLALDGRRSPTVARAAQVALGAAVATAPLQYGLPPAGRVAHGGLLLVAAVATSVTGGRGGISALG